MKSAWPQDASNILSSVISEIENIEKFEFTEKEISNFQNEDHFISGGISFLIEAASYLVVAYNIYNVNKSWTRNQAAIAGNIIRQYKLVSGILDQITQRRAEQAQIFVRLNFECIVNTLYLIEFYSDKLINDYIQFSFFHERDLLLQIDTNIASRGGIIKPIEDRMRKSITHAFDGANIKIEEMPKKKPKSWGGKSLYAKADALGLEEAYLAFVGGPSHSIHSAWYEIESNNLERMGDGTFKGVQDWSYPRPQVLLAMAQLTSQTIGRYFWFVGGDPLHKNVDTPLKNLSERIEKFTLSHESYLNTKNWAEI